MSLEENRFYKNDERNYPDYTIRDLIVYSDFAVVYKEHHRQPTFKSKQNIIESNVTKRKYNGFMSPQTKRKITKILEAWLSSIKYHNERNRNVPIRMQRRPVFVTLTLSDNQMHDDYEIKRKLLMPFLQHCQKHWDVKYYFWRAEKQENGRIHFHLILDKYIDRLDLQFVWNRIQNKLDYCENYYKTHYQKEPPSTQVQKVPESSDLVSYLIKYATKDDSKEIVKGRIWGCSDELRDLKPFIDNIDNGLSESLEMMRKSPYYTFVEKEHVTIIYFNKNSKKDSLPIEILSRIRKYYQDLYLSLYSQKQNKELADIIEENTEDICVRDYEMIWHQEQLQLDVFL